MIRAALVDRVIEPADLLAEVATPRSGATALFVGTVRETNDGRAVTAIDYASYVAMAEGELERIAREAGERFSVDFLVVEHRVGMLQLMETSVAIAASHAHRHPAMDCTRWVIEEIKSRVPIWKREHYADGSRDWVDPAPRSGKVAP